MVKSLPDLRKSVQKCIESDSTGHRMEAAENYIYAISELSHFLVVRYEQNELFTRDSENVIRLLSQCTERLGTVVEEAKATQKNAEVANSSSDMKISARKLGLIDPMAKAQAENSKLTIAHNYKIRSANFTASQIATMNLNLQRKIIENVEIAKQQKKLIDQRIAKRKDEITAELSKESSIPRELKSILVEVSTFEEEVPELKLYQKSLELKTDSDICTNYIRSIFEYGDHPLMVKLQESRSKLLQKLTRLAEQFESKTVAVASLRLSEISDAFHWENPSSYDDVPQSLPDPTDSQSPGATPFDVNAYVKAVSDLPESAQSPVDLSAATVEESTLPTEAELTSPAEAELTPTNAADTVVAPPQCESHEKELAEFILLLHGEMNKFGNYLVSGSSLHQLVEKCPDRQEELEEFSVAFVQNFYFKCLCPHLLKIYRCKTAKERWTLEKAQMELNKKGLAALGLMEEDLNYKKAEEAAIRVKKLLTMAFPADFTRSLVQFCRSVSAEIPTVTNSASLVNADDLVSLLCLVFLLAPNSADLISLIGVMEIFISDRKLLAEEGYCVVATISALTYLISLSTDDAK